jgi:PAS domain S-box-containing protein
MSREPRGRVLAGAGGEMGERIRAFDWSRTPLGPADRWPQSLRTAVQIMLGSRYPMFVWWGREHVNLYNDAYVPILGERHPGALGRPAKETWTDVWPVVGPQAEAVLDGRGATWNEEQLLIMERNQFLEETYFTFSYSPAPDDAGGVGGVFCACTEDTQRVLHQRRLRTLRLLGEAGSQAETAEQACALAAAVLARNPHDLPFALVYLLDRDAQGATLAGAAALAPGEGGSPTALDLRAADAPWPIRRVVETGEAVEIEDVVARVGRLPGGAWPEAPQRAIVLPIAKPGQERRAGAFVAGISPRLAFTDDYRAFLGLVAGHLANAIAGARNYEAERERSRALAELDRAKTRFFTNVSHEFRTPLTLILGPVEDMLARDDAGKDRQLLEVVHRHGLRLLKLVNTLLQFSRIEAGRIQAEYVPTDVGVLTRQLAGVFQSAFDRAGLRFLVDCPSVDAVVFVDRDMWEKIVFNLLSNALKFTFDGEVEVGVRRAGESIELAVRDTGVGIPARDLPHVFQRFHRVEGTRRRSHEGTGIGLALVAELARLHGGAARVESVEGRGTTFTVSIPLGSAHLPPDSVRATPALKQASPAPRLYEEEVAGWLPAAELDGAPAAAGWAEPADPSVPAEAGPRPRVLVADDNRDMRQHLVRVLSPRYDVEAVADGQAALVAMRRRRADLLLTDVMMPELDGFALLAHVRADPELRETPVIMLSARAGEEARSEGVGAGADDYLVKPFSSHELLVRIRTHLAMARARAEMNRALRNSEERYRSLTQALTSIVWTADARGGFATPQSPWCEYTGQTWEQARDFGWIGAIHPDDQARVSGLWQEACRDQRVYEADGRLWHEASGAYRYFEVRAVPIRNVDGTVREWVGTCIDLEDRVRAEAALRDSERRFSRFMQWLPGLAWIKDLDGKYVYVNDAAERAFGLPRASLYGRTDEDVFSPETAAQFRANDQRALASGAGIQTVETLDQGEGDVRFSLVTKFPILGPTGQAAWIGGMAIDITDRRAAEAALHASERRFRSMANATPALIWTADATGALTFHNQRWLDYTGVAPTLDSRDWAAHILHPDDAGRCLEAWKVALERGTDYEVEARIRRHDGDHRWFLTRATPIRDVEGRILEWYGTSTDIHDRKQVEDALRDREERLRVALQAARMGSWDYDLRTQRARWSSEMFEIYGLDPSSEPPSLERFVDLIHPEDRDLARGGIREAGRRGGSFAIEFRIVRPDGGVVWINTTGMVDLGLDGTPASARGIDRDVTASKEAEIALTEAGRRKDEFLALLAHELRNPLAPLRTGIELMRAAREQPEIVEQVRTMMARQLAHMVRLIDDLLDVSRISRGKVTLRKEKVRLQDVVQQAAEASMPAIEEAGQELAIRMPAETIAVEADPTRLLQVFCNLLDNAAKFSPRGGHIWLTVERPGDEVEVSVRDDGVGIPHGMLAEVFSMFTQVGQPLQRTTGGLGLGLSLVKEMVEMHGGGVEAHSDGPGLGSEFVVRLPVADGVVEGRAGDGEAPMHPRRCRVLVVDDNRDSAISMAMMLRLLGNEVQTAHDGLEALRMAASFRPDVVLLDIGMPNMNGYDAARRIRAEPWGRSLVLVAVTGWGQDSDRIRSREAGFDHHLVKPVDLAELKRMLGR